MLSNHPKAPKFVKAPKWTENRWLSKTSLV